MRHIVLRIAALRQSERVLRTARVPFAITVRHAATALRPEEDDGDFFDHPLPPYIPPSAEPGPSRQPQALEPIAEHWTPALHEEKLLPKPGATISRRQTLKELQESKRAAMAEGSGSTRFGSTDPAQPRPIPLPPLAAAPTQSGLPEDDADGFFSDPSIPEPTRAGQRSMSEDDLQEAMSAIASREETGISIDTWDPPEETEQADRLSDTEELDSLPINIDPYDVPLDPNFPCGSAIIRQLLTDHKFLTTQDIFRLATEGLKPVTEPKFMFNAAGQIRVIPAATRREIFREATPPVGPKFPSHPFKSMRHLKRVLLKGLADNNMVHIVRRMRPIIYAHELEAARWRAGKLTRRAERRAFRASQTPPLPYEPATHVEEYGWRIGAWLGDASLTVEPTDEQWEAVEKLERSYWSFKDRKRISGEKRSALRQVKKEERTAEEAAIEAEIAEMNAEVDIQREKFRQDAFENILHFARETGEDVTDWLDELSMELRHVPQHYLPKHYSDGGAKPMGKSREGWAPESIQLRSISKAKPVRLRTPVKERVKERAKQWGIKTEKPVTKTGREEKPVGGERRAWSSSNE